MEEFLPPYKLNSFLNSGYLLDANIVIEYINWLSNGKKTFRTIGKSIDSKVANLLLSYLDKYFQKTKIHTTPNIITEVTNMLGNIDKNPKKLSICYAELNKLMKSYDNEIYIGSKAASKIEYFETLGLTDTVFFEILDKKDILFLSFDFELISYLIPKYKKKVMNLHNLLPYLDA